MRRERHHRATVEQDVPVDGWTKPATIMSVVVLPEPLGPRSVTNSPGATVRSTSRTAAISP